LEKYKRTWSITYFVAVVVYCTEGEAQVEEQVIDSTRVEPLEQTSDVQTRRPQSFPLSYGENGASETIGLKCNPYDAVVKKKNMKSSGHRSRGTAVAQRTEPESGEEKCVISYTHCGTPWESKEHVYANVTPENQELIPSPPTPCDEMSKMPREYTDQAEGNKQYLYAVVDKERKKNLKVFKFIYFFIHDL